MFLLHGLSLKEKLLTGVLCSLPLIVIGNSLAEDRASAQIERGKIAADNLSYDSESQTIEAQGDVVVTSDGRTIKASKIRYERLNKLVHAQDDIYVEDELGNSFRAKRATMTEDFARGTLKDVHGEYNDHSRFVASEATKESEALYVLEHSAYSPCSLCANDKTAKKPFWRISAKEVEYDIEDQQVRYKHATLDLWGRSVLYTPYFSHAAPGATNKSGFLIPTYQNSSTLGFSVTTPYYWHIAPHMDATISPMITTDEGPVISAEFRHLTRWGQYELMVSGTNPNERDANGIRTGQRQFRGHVEGRGAFDLGQDWYAGFDVKRSTDDTYLQRYRFGYEDLLTSEAYVERIQDRNYFGVRTVSFQGLNQEDDSNKTPIALPLVDAHYETEPMMWNSRFYLDGNGLVLDRDEGVDVRRVSTTGGWKMPYSTKQGHLFEFGASVRGDLYSYENVLEPDGSENDGAKGRVIPTAKASWSFPMVRRGKATVMFEPLASVIISPVGNNPDNIPNEDSQELEISDVNLFSDNRFTGYDRVEGGPRTNYGFRGSVHHDWMKVNFLLGQSFHSTVDDAFTAQSGLDDNFSDYVGRIQFERKNMDVTYRFRADKDNFVMRRNELGVSYYNDRFSVYGSYIKLDEDDDTFDRQEVFGSASLKLTDHWSIYGNARQDIGLDEAIERGIGIVYEDDCVRVASELKRDYTRFEDIEPSTTYLVKIGLKNIGK